MRRIPIVSSVLVGLGVSFGVYVLFLQTPVISLSRLAFAFVLFLAFTVVNYFFTLHYLKERLTTVVARKPYIISLCILLPLLFLPLFYRTPAYPINPLLRQWTDVAVQYDVHANSHPLDFSKSAVRLQIDKDVLDARSFRVVGIWKSTGDTFSLDPGMSAALQWVGTASASMLLTLQAPAASGTLTIYWDQSRSVFELSPDAPKQIVMARKFSAPWGVGVLLYIAAYILIAWLLFVLAVLFDGKLYLLKKKGEVGCFGRAKPAQNTPHPALLKRYGKFNLIKLVEGAGSSRVLLVLLAIVLAVVTVKLQLDSLNGGADSYIHGAQLARHEAVLQGQAPNPWQYRVLSEYVAEGFIRLFQFLKVQDAISFGFSSLRVLQNLAIFLLAFALYRKVSSSKAIALLGFLLLASSMKNAFYDNDLSFNTYFDLIFYLLAVLLILNRKYYWVVLVTACAALNRETSGLIPFLALAALVDEELPIHKRLLPFILSGTVFAAIFLGLHLLYPNRPLYIPYEVTPGYPMLIYNVTRAFTWNQLFSTLGLIPAIGLLFIFNWPRLWQRFFLIMCPAWFAIHFMLSIAGETRLFLVPQALIFIPGVLFAVKYLIDLPPLRERRIL